MGASARVLTHFHAFKELHFIVRRLHKCLICAEFRRFRETETLITGILRLLLIFISGAMVSIIAIIVHLVKDQLVPCRHYC